MSEYVTEIAELQEISPGLSPHKMLLATAVPDRGLVQAIAPPLEALLLLKVQLVIIGAEFLNVIAPPVYSRCVVAENAINNQRFIRGIKCQPAAVPIGCVVFNDAVGNGR